MQDIGGCRAIVSSEKKLRKIVRELKKNPELKDASGTVRLKDYIKYPKDDGYRSYHLVGRFTDSSGIHKSIEIQLRTKIQHYWATALEIVDLFTGQALKSNQGDEDWKTFFLGISKQFALMESIHIFDQLQYKEQFDSYNAELRENEEKLSDCLEVQFLGKKLEVQDKLDAFANSLRVIDDRIDKSPNIGYVLLEIDTINTTVTSRLYRRDKSKKAEEDYTATEQAAAGKHGVAVALVSTTAVGGIKEAYPNYFADSTMFLEHLHLVFNIKNPKQRSLFERIVGA